MLVSFRAASDSEDRNRVICDDRPFGDVTA